ncbi:MAG: GNAT family N-acetyltransferase [Armatimonadota bacterium]
MFYYPIADDAELRLLEPRYAQELFELVNRNREYLRRWFDWVDGTAFVEQVKENRQRKLQLFAENGCFEAGIWYQGQLAGIVGIHEIDWRHRSTSLGYWLGESYQGKGLMTRACKALLCHLFDDLALHRVEIRSASANTRSRAVAERLGFTHEATLRSNQCLHDEFVDFEVYAMLRDEWKGHR